jgi:MoaA/NifB/PqqE/SkfB family radical SAM enzyme
MKKDDIFIINELVIPPVTLSLIVTNKCTSACLNCCFQCNPMNNTRLSLHEAKRYIDQSIEAYNSIKLLVITGGECFTLRKDLDRIIDYSTSKGLHVRVVTNAYWAISVKNAYFRLKDLVNVGLQELNISTGDEHQKWVPYDNIIFAITAAMELNLLTVVNVETSKISQFNINQLKTDYRLDKYKHLFEKKLIIIGGVWMPFVKSTEFELNSSEKRQEKQIIWQEKIGRCTSLFNTISIHPTHYMNACCGLTSEYIPYLRLGSLKKNPIKFLYEYQFQDFLKIWLFTEGPKNILDFCFKKRDMPMFNVQRGIHICQICIEIFREKQNITILQQNYEELFSNVMFKYSILKEKYTKQLNLINYESK